MQPSSAGTVDVDRIARYSDGIVKVPAGENVILRHHILANDAPRFPNAEEWRGLGEIGVLESGNVIDEIGDDVVDLRATFDFAFGQSCGRRCRRFR